MGSQGQPDRLSCSGRAIQPEAGAAAAQDTQPVVAGQGLEGRKSFSTSSYREGETQSFNVGTIMHVVLFV